MESEDNAERRFDAPLHAGGKDTLLVCMPVTGNVTLTVAILSSDRIFYHQQDGEKLSITSSMLGSSSLRVWFLLTLKNLANGEHNTTPMYSEC